MNTNGSSQQQGIDTIALPILEDYDVSKVTGFVPYPQPLDTLPLPYYEPWEDIMKQLNQLIDSRQLRSRVDQMPLLDVGRLETTLQKQRAYTLLSIMAHSYVWGSGLDIAQSIPAPLAVPWQAVSDILDIPPVLTYAANDLWNWKLIDPKGPYTLENLSTQWTMTGTYDETWFDIVALSVEIEGGAALQPLLDAMQAVREDNLGVVTTNLKTALPQLQKVGKQLARMFEKCDPAVFYWKIRKFLAGSENMAALGLPNGLEFKGVNNNERKHHMGATAGQSSLFPALDIIFGVDHHDTNPSQPGQKSPNALLLKMKGFMPAPHRALLDHLAQVANLRAYVLSKKELASDSDGQIKDLVETFDACVQQIKLFRDTHIQIVTRYILTQAKRGPPEGWEDYRVQVPAAPTTSTSSSTDNEEEEPAIQGTGGSDLMPFLKTNRDETNAAKVQATTSKW
ncbi:Indoleamine 2,3-dioxygenase [Mortierella sp. GBAus27b]|nr:Indoleamine 2,3-dioxygenase [Mortierella sp. GBAus27b]